MSLSRRGLATLLGYADSSEGINVNRLLALFGVSYGSEQVHGDNETNS